MTGGLCPFCRQGAMRRQGALAADYITGDGFEIWNCPACGGARTLPVPGDLSRYYPERYRHYAPLIAWILGLLYRSRVRGWARSVERPGAAFELGCGNGLMLDQLRRLGW